MNIAELSIRHRTITLVMTLLLIGGGLWAYEGLGRLEDPEFTIKEAQVFTRYPGATAYEVAEEVTDVIETAVQQMGQLKLVTSISDSGLSTVRVEMKDKYDKSSLPQVWDELRRKVNDAQGDLPPGAGPSLVFDDFGDVFGVLYAVYGDGYTYAELKEHAKLLRRELLLCDDVGKITISGDQQEVIYVEISRARLAQLGISPELVFQSLAGQNLVTPAGQVEVDSKYIRIQPSGEFQSIEDIGEVMILQPGGAASNIRIKDIAQIRRDYVDPPSMIIRYGGRRAIGLGISTVAGGNVVTMGASVDKRLAELKAETPIGIEIGVIAHQAEAVNVAVNGFVVSLVEAIAIVVGVLMLTMGLRSGLLIGFILLLTVLGTFILMMLQGVMLERISLGALIIALGMLVDNAIVIVEGILINQQKGMKPVEAAVDITRQTMWPLFGATIVAILAFAAIGASQDSTGEYCRSLFMVILYSLLLSWILAITVTPLFGVMFLKVKSTKASGGGPSDPYGGLLFRGYRGLLLSCLRMRWYTLIVLAVLLVAAGIGFGQVSKSFFPPSTRPQFLVHYWLPQGTHINRTQNDIVEIEEYVQEVEGVTGVASFIGQGAPRFLLTYTPEEANSAYGLILVSVEDYLEIDDIMTTIQAHIDDNFPDALAFQRLFILGPGDPQKIQVRFRGPDPDVLRRLAVEAKKTIHDEPSATDILDDWRQRVLLIRPIVAETQARNAGITRAQIASALRYASTGSTVGVYREQDELLPIIARSPESERDDVSLLRDVQVWSPVAGRAITLRQVVIDFETQSEDSRVRRRNRVSTITVKCDPAYGEASAALEALRPAVEARFEELKKEMDLSGYTLEWGGEYEDSGDAQAALASKIPPIVLLMVLTVIILFDAVRLPLLIFLTVPLAAIGVTAGLLITSQPFGFMALLGFMSLAGMLIKNAIVLIDEINVQIATGKDRFQAVVDSGVSRVRPVSMAALTTVLGMIPLLADAFFKAMAVTIMFGLTFATILTLVVVPVLYVCFFHIPNPTAKAQSA